MRENEQLKLNIENVLYESCLFTGHRELDESFDKNLLQESVENAVQNGVKTFYVGMAKGFDLLCAETVVKIKENYPFVKMIACIPCYNQEKSYSQADKKRYVELIKKADERVILSENYYRGCMQNRDRYMAEKGDMMICYCRKKTGGTAYTLSYFQKRKPTAKVIFL